MLDGVVEEVAKVFRRYSITPTLYRSVHPHPIAGLISALVGKVPGTSPPIERMQCSMSFKGKMWLTICSTGNLVASMIRSAASVASLSAGKQPCSFILFQTNLSINIGVTVVSPVKPPSTIVDWRCRQSTDFKIALGLPETSTTTSH